MLPIYDRQFDGEGAIVFDKEALSQARAVSVGYEWI
jgi:hypothetical protein